jgi:mRNA interferase MazF
VNLDPTLGSEIKKTRPCLILSSDEMNRHIRSVIIVPMTPVRRDYASRVDVTFQRKKGQVVLDQIRTVDEARLVRNLGRLPEQRGCVVASLLQQIFA